VSSYLIYTKSVSQGTKETSRCIF